MEMIHSNEGRRLSEKGRKEIIEGWDGGLGEEESESRKR
jgi:hypothetical protein